MPGMIKITGVNFKIAKKLRLNLDIENYSAKK